MTSKCIDSNIQLSHTSKHGNDGPGAIDAIEGRVIQYSNGVAASRWWQRALAVGLHLRGRGT